MSDEDQKKMESKDPRRGMIRQLPTDEPCLPSAEYLERPSIYIFPEDVFEEVFPDDSKVIAQGPWVAVATPFGWLCGELVGEVDDAITIRSIYSMDEDGPIYRDTGVMMANVFTWSTLEGDRWAHPSDDDEPQQSTPVDPLTNFPKRVK